MPTNKDILHRTFDDMGLPYVTNSSPISTDPQYISGQNILTSLLGRSERRPGFSASLEPNPRTFVNLKQGFQWRRYDDASSGATRGAFFAMFCDVVGNTSLVYKLQIGTDATAQLIWSDTTSLTGNRFDFVFSNNQCYFGNGTAGNMRRYDGTTVYQWGINTPTWAPGITLGGTGISAAVSYCYLVTYGYGTGTGASAVAVGESSPGPISACSGVFSNKTVSLSLTASADPQVNQIHVYRTTDGGSVDPLEMREIVGSPFANASATVTDTTTDALLSIETAPANLRNDPPPPARGFQPYAGRIWSFNTNQVYYSGFEEIGRGVPEECWPSGLDGNNYPFESEVTAIAPLTDGVATFVGGRIGKIEGDSLDTFRRYTLVEKRGTRASTSVSSLAGSVAWVDTSKTIWESDLGEIGLNIRPDAAALDIANCYTAIHISGQNHWLMVLDSTNGNLLVYDLDRKQWMTPWKVNASCMWTGETAVGQTDLMVALGGTKVMKIVPGTYNDNGATYSASIGTNQFNIAPQQNPSWKGVVDWIEWKQDTHTPSKVEQLTDDDPAMGTYVDLTANIANSPEVTPGTGLLIKRATSNSPTAQLASLRITWPAEDANFKVYVLDVASHPVGT